MAVALKHALSNLCAQTAEREQNPRGINRHKFSLEEAEAATQQPVVQALFDLCRFRNEHKAFNGKVGVMRRFDVALAWTSLGLVPGGNSTLVHQPIIQHLFHS